MKPILFNTEMVRAILEGRKSVTRRPVKPQPAGELRRMGADSCYPGCFAAAGEDRVYQPPYMAGDVLYVRETWNRIAATPDGHFYPPGVYYYKAGPIKAPERVLRKWRPSIHMPREAARIFLRVTTVRVEQLGWMEKEDVLREGVRPQYEAGGCRCQWEREGCREKPCPNREGYITFCHLIPFWKVWDSTMKAEDRKTYGWEANPWVWVIEFERISKEEAKET